MSEARAYINSPPFWSEFALNHSPNPDTLSTWVYLCGITKIPSHWSEKTTDEDFIITTRIHMGDDLTTNSDFNMWDDKHHFPKEADAVTCMSILKEASVEDRHESQIKLNVMTTAMRPPNIQYGQIPSKEGASIDLKSSLRSFKDIPKFSNTLDSQLAGVIPKWDGQENIHGYLHYVSIYLSETGTGRSLIPTMLVFPEPMNSIYGRLAEIIYSKDPTQGRMLRAAESRDTVREFHERMKKERIVPQLMNAEEATEDDINRFRIGLSQVSQLIRSIIFDMSYEQVIVWEANGLLDSIRKTTVADSSSEHRQVGKCFSRILKYKEIWHDQLFNQMQSNTLLSILPAIADLCQPQLLQQLLLLADELVKCWANSLNMTVTELLPKNFKTTHNETNFVATEINGRSIPAINAPVKVRHFNRQHDLQIISLMGQTIPYITLVFQSQVLQGHSAFGSESSIFKLSNEDEDHFQCLYVHSRHQLLNHIDAKTEVHTTTDSTSLEALIDNKLKEEVQKIHKHHQQYFDGLRDDQAHHARLMKTQLDNVAKYAELSHSRNSPYGDDSKDTYTSNVNIISGDKPNTIYKPTENGMNTNSRIQYNKPDPSLRKFRRPPPSGLINMDKPPIKWDEIIVPEFKSFLQKKNISNAQDWKVIADNLCTICSSQYKHQTCRCPTVFAATQAGFEKYGHMKVAEKLTRVYQESINNTMLMSGMNPPNIAVTCEDAKQMLLQNSDPSEITNINEVFSFLMQHANLQADDNSEELFKEVEHINYLNRVIRENYVREHTGSL